MSAHPPPGWPGPRPDLPTFRLFSNGRIVCEFSPDPALWIDLQSFAEASGRSLAEIIRDALTEFLIGR